MAKEKPFFASCLAAWKPEVDNTIFYSCSADDNHDLYGNSIEDLASQYAAIILDAGKIKRRANIIHEGKYLGWIDGSGITRFPEPMSFSEFFRKIKRMALENAKQLKITEDVLNQIERGNFHEVDFFSDARCLDWKRSQPGSPVVSDDSSSLAKNIGKVLEPVYRVVEAATRNGKQAVMEGQLCLF